MTGGRSRYGLLVSAFGALVLAASVFLFWYVPAAGDRGSAPLHRPGALTGMSSLGGLGFVLLAVAGLALLDTVTPLVRAAGAALPAGAGGAVVLLGALASALIAFRMLQPPGTAALSLREGPWVALLGALTVSAGGMWPGALPGIDPIEPLGPGIFSTFTGWTPGA